jgi:hypothetical protein
MTKTEREDCGSYLTTPKTAADWKTGNGSGC